MCSRLLKKVFAKRLIDIRIIIDSARESEQRIVRDSLQNGKSVVKKTRAPCAFSRGDRFPESSFSA